MAYGDIVEHGGKQYRDITPNMTSLKTPAPYKITVATPYGCYDCPEWLMFDGRNNTGSSWTGSDVTITFDFGEVVCVDYMELWLGNDSDYRRITVYGSNDNVNFDQLCSAKSYNTKLPQIHPDQKRVLPQTAQYRFFKFSSEGSTGWYAVNNLRLYQKIVTDFFVLFDEAVYKTVEANNLQTLPDFTVTAESLRASGFANVNLIGDVIDQLSDTFDLLRYSPDSVNALIQINHLPAPQMITPTTDINVSAYSSIKQITLTTTGTTGVAKVIFSFDDGITWQTYANGAWAVIEPTADAVAASGISPADVATIPSEAWSVVTGKLRVAYYLSKVAVTDDLALAKFTIIGDTSSWKKAQRSVDYRVILPNTSTMAVQLLSDGSYKINYMESK